jgi:PRTRC genetic system protein C
MRTEKITRAFIFEGRKLPDPDPSATPEQVRETYAAQYPELSTAAIEGPEMTGSGERLYTFARSIGTKG